MASTTVNGYNSYPGSPAAVLQPLLRVPMGDLGTVQAMKTSTTVPQGMTPSEMLKSDVLPVVALKAPASYGMVVVGASRWVEGTTTPAAEVRAGFAIAPAKQDVRFSSFLI